MAGTSKARSSTTPPKSAITRFVKSSGSFDETWYAPQNYSRTSEYKGISHRDSPRPTVSSVPAIRAGTHQEEVNVRRLLVTPLPNDPLDPSDHSAAVQDVTTGKSSCLLASSRSTKWLPWPLPGKEQKEAVDHSPRLCFDPAAPVLRFAEHRLTFRCRFRSTRSHNLHGHLVAQEINVTQVLGAASKNTTVPILRIQLCRKHPSRRRIQPAPWPFLLAHRSSSRRSPLRWESIASTRIPQSRANQGHFPAGAPQEHQEGDVNIAIVIAPDGTVTSAKIVDGIQMFREYALDFVKKSGFKPFLLSGTPVEVTYHREHPLQPMQMGSRQHVTALAALMCTANPQTHPAPAAVAISR